MRALGGVGLLAFVCGFMALASQAQADPASLLESADSTVLDMRSDPTFGPSQDLLRRARAVLIVPTLVKGGFIFGAEGGNGVMLAHYGRRWSDPAFYTLASASFGLQIGLEAARLVMFVMSDRALRALEQDRFKFGGEAGLTVITIGANAQGATGANLSGDIIVWASSKGAYGGLTLEGSILEPKSEWNASFYGRPLSVPQILSDTAYVRMAAPLRRDLVLVH